MRLQVVPTQVIIAGFIATSSVFPPAGVTYEIRKDRANSTFKQLSPASLVIKGVICALPTIADNLSWALLTSWRALGPASYGFHQALFNGERKAVGLG